MEAGRYGDCEQMAGRRTGAAAAKNIVIESGKEWVRDLRVAGGEAPFVL
jgi:hypothetical protein